MHDSQNRVDVDTLQELAVAAERKWNASVIVRTERGDNAHGTSALLIAEILSWGSDDDLVEVPEDDDRKAWQLARDAHAVLKLEPPCQVWVGECGLGRDPLQMIYSV
jgi:hypothetical protein